MNDEVDFGYQKVAKSDKEKLVGKVFSSVARRYDIMNDLMSLGIHRLWKRTAIHLCAPRPGQIILDVAGGTGDLTKLFAKKIGSEGTVYLLDINKSMLCEGRTRLINEGFAKQIQYVLANAEQLPFCDRKFDCISIAFGLRNVTDKLAALRSMYRVLKPGGRLVILEFSKPPSHLLRSAYDFYSFNIIPKIGECVAHDKESYQYLVESIRMHPDQETLKTMIEEAGFSDCEYFNLSGGIVAVHRAFKYG